MVDVDGGLPKIEPTKFDPYLYAVVNPDTDELTWHCDLCPKTFSSKGNLNRHRFHHFEPTHLCPHCGKLFHNDNGLKQHLFQVHSNQKDFVCHICRYATLTKYSLQLHIIRKHTKDYPLSCEVCGKGYAKKHLLDAHRASVHDGVEHVCEECGKTFKYVHTLQNHRKRHFSSTRKKELIKCDLCGEKLKHLKVHMARVHNGFKTFICEICGEGFHAKNLLSIHVSRKHKSEKSFKCCFCVYAVHTKQELTMHVKKRHSVQESPKDIKERPFQCTFCLKRFKFSTSLTDHVRKHTGDKAYSCNACDEKFISKHYLRAHNCGGIMNLVKASK